MIIILTNIKSGEPIKLSIPIDNRHHHKKVALYEAFYRISRINIYDRINWLKKYNPQLGGGERFIVEDGYYDFATLEKELFQQAGITLTLNPANGRVTIHSSSAMAIAAGLLKMLGFTQPPNTPDWQEVNFIAGNDIAGEIIKTGDSPINLSGDPLLFMHLSQIKSTQNQVVVKASSPSIPSDLLTILLPTNTTPNAQQHHTKTKLQYSELEEGFHETFTITIKDIEQKRVDCDSLHVILKIK